MSEFKREERYIVVKLKRIDDETEEALREFLVSWQIPTEQCVVVEHDWPNYEDTWRAIEQIEAGTYTPGEAAQTEEVTVEPIAWACPSCNHQVQAQLAGGLRDSDKCAKCASTVWSQFRPVYSRED